MPAIAQSPQVGGVGRGVSLTTVNEGWGMTPAERRRYGLQFGTHDLKRTGFLTANEARQVLNQTGLGHSVLAKIWTLADVDKDGRLSQDEFAIAMHLVEKARKGLTIPVTLPPELLPSGASSQSEGSDSKPSPSPASTPSRTPMTFEDKKKENFDAGRQELERRRRALQERQEREEAEKERKRRQEEEQHRQQE
jgi:hypothetical protein